jgi:hypothetical protein
MLWDIIIMLQMFNRKQFLFAEPEAFFAERLLSNLGIFKF